MPGDLAKLLAFRVKRERPRIRLFCLPFAGGAASIYRGWSAQLPDHVDVCPIELPGRGTRFGEPPVEDSRRLLEELSALRELTDLPTVFFGHSLGGRIAFALIRAGMRADALILSASRPAYQPLPRIRSSLSKEALVRELRRLGGAPPAVLNDSEMLELMLPIVRADFRILETLSAAAEDKVQCPVTVLAATDDIEVPLPDMEKWKVHAGGDYRFVQVPAGHFFLATHADTVLGEVRRVLDAALAS